MGLSYGDYRRFDDKLDLILANQVIILSNQGKIMASQQQVLDDLDTINSEIAAFIADHEAIDDALRAQVKDLTDKLAADEISLAAFQTGTDAAFEKAEKAKDALKKPGNPVTPLDAKYDTRALFDAAVAAYAGPEEIDVDGGMVKPGTTPALAYFTHSADGSVSTTGPTD